MAAERTTMNAGRWAVFEIRRHVLAAFAYGDDLVSFEVRTEEAALPAARRNA